MKNDNNNFTLNSGGDPPVPRHDGELSQYNEKCKEGKKQ